MRKLKFQLDRDLLQIIYISFLRPLLKYTDVVWNHCAQYEIAEFEKNEATRIVTGALLLDLNRIFINRKMLGETIFTTRKHNL